MDSEGRNDFKNMKNTSQESKNASQDSWSKFKGKIKSAWSDITDEDIDSSRENIDQMSRKIKQRLGTGTEADVTAKLNQFSKDTDYSFDKKEKMSHDDSNAQHSNSQHKRAS